MIEFLSFWLANTIGILVLSFLFGGNVVLGNDKVMVPMAALITGLIFTLFGALVDPIVRKTGLLENIRSIFKGSGLKVKDEALWGVIYLAANIVIVWVVKRFALVIGLGIGSILFTLITAVVLTGAQWIAAMATGVSQKHKN